MTPRARWARRVLVGAAWLFAVGVLAQTLFAGRAVFVGPGWWLRHRDFVHAFEWLSPLAVVLAHAGRLPRATTWLAWLTVALLLVQYVTAGFRETVGRQGWAAFHAVGGVVLFWAAAELARGAWRAAREAGSPPG